MLHGHLLAEKVNIRSTALMQRFSFFQNFCQCHREFIEMKPPWTPGRPHPIPFGVWEEPQECKNHWSIHSLRLLAVAARMAHLSHLRRDFYTAECCFTLSAAAATMALLTPCLLSSLSSPRKHMSSSSSSFRKSPVGGRYEKVLRRRASKIFCFNKQAAA